jgi:hypothetical protein
LSFPFSFSLLTSDRQRGTGGTAPVNCFWDVVIARKLDDHAASREEFAKRG